MTNNKLNDYKKLNSNQSGGSNLSNDKEFLNQLNKISSDLELTFSEFKKIISSKIKPETDNDIFVKVVDQLDDLDNKVDELSKKFNINPTNKNASSSISDSIKNIENNIEKIIDVQKNTNEKITKVNQENKSNYCTIS